MSEPGGHHQGEQPGGPYGPPSGPQYPGGPPPGPPQYGAPHGYGPQEGPPQYGYGPQEGPPQYGRPPYGHPGYGAPDDEVPGQLIAARGILFIQGGLGVLLSLRGLAGSILIAGPFMAEEPGLFLLAIVAVLIMVAVTVLTFLLAARFTRRRRGIRIRILALEGILGALQTVSAVDGLSSGDVSSAPSLIFAVLCWTVFIILLTKPAKRYFNAV